MQGESKFLMLDGAGLGGSITNISTTGDILWFRIYIHIYDVYKAKTTYIVFLKEKRNLTLKNVCKSMKVGHDQYYIH